MNRRTLLRRLGATGVAATAVAGTTAARTAPTEYGIDREIDVSDVAGRVTLEELLNPRDLASLSDDVDPAAEVIEVAEDVDSVAIDDCCVYCSKYPSVCDCGTGCCRLSVCACPNEFC